MTGLPRGKISSIMRDSTGFLKNSILSISGALRKSLPCQPILTTGSNPHGHEQRTAIARSPYNDPDFVILDEPSTGLDILAMESVKSIISGLGARGKTVLFSSHFTDEILGCADRVVILHGGTIACDSPVDAFRPEGGKNFTDYLRHE